MSRAWVLRTRQMSEAGKEILLREALVNHMRSSRDRTTLASILGEPRPFEDILSSFASFYLYHYSGIRLQSTETAFTQPTEGHDDVAAEERRQLELECRQFLGTRLTEEIDIARLVSEFTVRFCDELGNGDPYDPDVLHRTDELVREHLAEIPSDYGPIMDVDFVVQVTGWGDDWRRELYERASGLKESALSLRDELLREHEYEVIEVSVLKRALKRIFGRLEYPRGRLLHAPVSEEVWAVIAKYTARRLLVEPRHIPVIRRAHALRLSLLEALQMEFESPATLEEYEARMARTMAREVGSMILDDPQHAAELLAHLLGLAPDTVRKGLRQAGLDDGEQLARGLLEVAEEGQVETGGAGGPALTQAELDQIERSLRTLEKLERALEKPVKGALRARGMRASELDKVTIEVLTRPPESLIGVEVQVLEELKKKMRVPPPEEVVHLLEVRRRVESGELGAVATTSGEMGLQRRTKESLLALRLDIVWHLTTGLLTNLTRIVEMYIRSKNDLLRMKALLKSIYEDTEPRLQSLREEILIDLASRRIYEAKCVLPDLDAPTICTWMHARLSGTDMDSAKEELRRTPSPVFEGIVDAPLRLDGLEFDNYAIAYDIMHRFLQRERQKKMKKEEEAAELQLQGRAVIDRKRRMIDVVSWIHTKATTAFKAVGRVGSRGLEWGPNDSIKCANLLSYYVRSNRGRRVCTLCGAAPSGESCPRHGAANMKTSDDLDNLAVFVMDAITAIKRGLIGTSAEAMRIEEARSIVQREIGHLKRRGKLSPRADLRAMMAGDIDRVVGPAIAAVVGKYFNESLRYAARGAGIA